MGLADLLKTSTQKPVETETFFKVSTLIASEESTVPYIILG